MERCNDLVALEDPYVVLGLERDATEEQIKSAYKKAALKYHPDKNRGEGSEAAADKFREVVTAYNILIDPDKRRRYDAGGFENLEASELEVEIDLSSIGTMNTVVAAMFSKLGVPIKTTISQLVLDAAAEGKFQTIKLEFGQPVRGKVDKQEAVFFELDVSQQLIDEGFYVFAHSNQGSKFKLLMFRRDSSDNRLGLSLQEDCSKTGKQFTTAGLFFLQFDTFSLGPKPSALETAEDPEAELFRRLDSLRKRETSSLQPGTHIFAVYGDNWFNRGKYEIEAVRVQRPGTYGPALILRDVEASLAAKKGELRGFEKEYRWAQSEYLAACEKFGKMHEEVEEMLRKRDDAYLSLFEAETAGPSGSSMKQKAVKVGADGSTRRTSLNHADDGAGEDENGADGRGRKEKQSPLAGLNLRNIFARNNSKS
eukprot:CAMPEP_0177763588 /NCGR_PEP_ID=MMETSP0491_2-20121128/6950_1 /TAXON_ID=63592 /ORGANISM="Tetraselmis chuii, Strain PLY429" /LENGTH=424 /DNA_ID=CAMNT_0019279703 /DNA_START=143 /DNA_END=1417 /DNA_ORIENTATION=-